MKTLFVLILLGLSFLGGVYVGQSTSFYFKGMVDGWTSGVGTSAPAPEQNTETSTPSASASEASPEQYRAWISEARRAHPYPESEEKMHAVMMCESGGNAEIVNPAGPYSGLFQYAAGTWNGDWNDYRGSDIFDARAQIFATALAWNKGMQSHWGCYNRAH